MPPEPLSAPAFLARYLVTCGPRAVDAVQAMARAGFSSGAIAGAFREAFVDGEADDAPPVSGELGPDGPSTSRSATG